MAPKQKRKAVTILYGTDDEAEPSPAKKPNSSDTDKGEQKQDAAAKAAKAKAEQETLDLVRECAWKYGLHHGMERTQIEWEWTSKLYYTACKKLEDSAKKNGFPSASAATGLTSFFRDCQNCSLTSDEKKEYDLRIKFVRAFCFENVIPVAPGTTAAPAVEFWDHRTDKDYKDAAPDIVSTFMAVLYPVKRFIAGGLRGMGASVLLNMPDGTTKEIEAGTPEYKEYWDKWNGKKPFQPHDRCKDIQTAYLWGDAKKPDAYDELDKKLIAACDPLKPDGSFLGLHTYGGYHGFFRPSLDEIIPMLIKSGVKIDASVARIYVTTEPWPNDKASQCYDGVLDRHRAITMWWIVRK